jgi:hypothetical protein
LTINPAAGFLGGVCCCGATQSPTNNELTFEIDILLIPMIGFSSDYLQRYIALHKML